MHVKLTVKITIYTAAVELTNNDPTLTFHKCFLGFNLTHMLNMEY